MNFQETLTFPEGLSRERVERATEVFGRPVVLRLVGFALFLLGGQREEIAKLLGMPVGTFFSFLTRLHRIGLDGFRDRRAGRTLAAAEPPKPTRVEIQGGELAVELPAKKRLRLPRSDPLQCRVVLLNLLESGVLSAAQAAQALGLSDRHLRLLRQKMRQGGALALVDQRRGQQGDYRVDAQTKGELILQFVVAVITGKPATGEQLAKELKEHHQKDLPARTVRLHLSKLGLPDLKETLPTLLADVKRGS